jgi:hypothetical protein
MTGWQQRLPEREELCFVAQLEKRCGAYAAPAPVK